MTRQGQGGQRRDEEQSTALTVVQPPRLPLPPQAAEIGIDPGEWAALVDSVFPSAKSVGGVMLAIRYCRARQLDIFKRPVHVVPMWNSTLNREVETVWPGIGEYRTTASRTGLWAGNDDCQFGETKKHKFHDKKTRGGRNGGREYVAEEQCEMEFPEWAQITVYKMVQGQRVAFVGPKVRFMETFSGKAGLNVPNDRWQRAPFQMLEKCAEAAALRRAFPDELGDSWTAEEAEGKVFESSGAEEFADVQHVEPVQAEPKPKRESVKQREERERADYWGPSGLDEFMAYMREGFGTVKSQKAIDRALEAEKQGVAMLPPDKKKELDEIVEATRARVRGDRPADEAAPADDPAGADEEEPTDDERFRRYLDDLVRFAKDATTPVDVNSLKSREKQAIGQLNAAGQKEAEAIFDVAMQIAKGAQGTFDAMLEAKLHDLAGSAPAAGSDAGGAEEEK